MAKGGFKNRDRQANLYGVTGGFPKTRKKSTRVRRKARLPPPSKKKALGPDGRLEQNSQYSMQTVFREDGTVLEGRHRDALRRGMDPSLHRRTWTYGAMPPGEFSKPVDPSYTAYNRPFEESLQRPLNWRPQLSGSPLLWPEPGRPLPGDEPPSPSQMAAALFDYLIPESPGGPATGGGGGGGGGRVRPQSSPQRAAIRSAGRRRPDSAAPVLRTGRARPGSAVPRPGSARPGSAAPRPGSARPGSAAPSRRPPRPQSAAPTRAGKRPQSAAPTRGRPLSGAASRARPQSSVPRALELSGVVEEEAAPATINRKPLREVPPRPQSAYNSCTATFSWRAPVSACTRCVKRLPRPESAPLTEDSLSKARLSSLRRRPASAMSSAPVFDVKNPGYRLGLDPPHALQESRTAPALLPAAASAPVEDDAENNRGIAVYRNPHSSAAKPELVRVAGVAREADRTHTVRLTSGVLRRADTEGRLARERRELDEESEKREALFRDACLALHKDRPFHGAHVTTLFSLLRQQAVLNLPDGEAERYAAITFGQYTGVHVPHTAKKLFSKKPDPVEDARIGATLPLPLWVDRAQFVKVMKAVGVTSTMRVLNQVFSAFDVAVEDCMDIGAFCHTFHDLRERTMQTNAVHQHQRERSRSRAGSLAATASPSASQPPSSSHMSVDPESLSPRRFSYDYKREAVLGPSSGSASSS